MADVMEFPETVEEFMEGYRITDTEQIYTNGSDLVPIYRMNQWFEHQRSLQARQVANDELVNSISEKLCKFDEFISSYTRVATDRHIGLYEHWIDCRYDIEKVMSKCNKLNNISLPCGVGDTIYRVDTDPNIDNDSDVKFEAYTVENIVILKDEILFKYDAFDGVICTLDNLISGTLYLDFYKVFLSEDKANRLLQELRSEKHE